MIPGDKVAQRVDLCRIPGAGALFFFWWPEKPTFELETAPPDPPVCQPWHYKHKTAALWWKYSLALGM